jgi:predicted secreted protein
MAVINGNNIGVYVGGQLIGCLTNATFNSTNNTIDVTCKDNNGQRAILPSGNTATIEFEGMFNPAATYGLQDLIDIHKNQTEVSVGIGDQTNLTIYAQAYLNTLSFTGPLNAGTTFSGTFEVTGVWNKYES